MVRERPSLRCQDLEGHFPVLGGAGHQTAEACHTREHEDRSRHEVEEAVDSKVCHQTRPDQWAEYRANPTHQNEP